MKKEQFASAILDALQPKPSSSDQVWDEDNLSEEWDLLEAEDLSNPEADELDSSGPVVARMWKQPGGPAEIEVLEASFTLKYTEYVRMGDDPVQESRLLNDILEILQTLCTYIVFRRIRTVSVYRQGDEMTIIQNGHVDAFLALCEDRSVGTPRFDALRFYRRIYKNKTMDYFRSYGLCKTRKQKELERKMAEEGVQAVQNPYVSSGLPRKRDIACADSIEALTTDEDGESTLDHFAPLSGDPFANNDVYRSDNSRKLLTVYLRELLRYERKPAGPLAVMYARVLYQLERVMDPNAVEQQIQSYMRKQGWSTDPADKHYALHMDYAADRIKNSAPATNPNWAIGRMGRKTIRSLTDDSEASLHRHLDKTLCWGEKIRGDLEAPAAASGAEVLGDLVYADTYTKRQIEHWAIDVHNSMTIRAAKAVRQDRELLDYVMDTLIPSHKLKLEISAQIQKDLKKQEKKTRKKEVECR